jgi:DNA-binding NtrC family response regulator
MRHVFKLVDRVAATLATIVLTRKSGTDKEAVAPELRDHGS